MNHKIFFLAIFLATTFLCSNSFAFTGLTHQYFSSKILTGNDLNCYNQFMAGTIAPDNSTVWQTYSDLTPQNHHCTNNDLNCTSRQKSVEYKQKSEEATDSCQKSYLLGISLHLMEDSYSPAHWASLSGNCHSEFEKKIENAITNFVPNYDVQQECQTDSNNTVRLRFTQFDENNLVSSLKTFYTATQTGIQQKVIQQTAKDIIGIISSQLDRNTSQADIELTTQLLTELEAYSCLLSPIRKKQAFEQWKQLDQTSKTCLKDFTSGKGTQAYTFAAECSAFNYGTGDPYALYAAQSTLDQYFQYNFAQKQCRELYIPTLTLSGISPTQGMLKQQICEYVPTQSIKGCVAEFEQDKKDDDQIWQDATAETAAVILILGLIAWKIIALFWTSGN